MRLHEGPQGSTADGPELLDSGSADPPPAQVPATAGGEGDAPDAEGAELEAEARREERRGSVESLASGGEVALANIASQCYGDSSADRFIESCPIFTDCGGELVSEVVSKTKKLVCQSGQTIVKEGMHLPNSMFFVLLGSLEVTYKGDFCRVIGQGEWFGAAEMVGAARQWQRTVTVKSASIIWELSGSGFREVLQGYPEERARLAMVVDDHTRLREEQDPHDYSAMRQSALFRDCSEPLLRNLESSSERRIYFAGEKLFSEGETGSAMFVLDHGVVTLEIAGRVVQHVEMPKMPTKLSYSSESKIDEFPPPPGGEEEGAEAAPSAGAGRGSVVVGDTDVSLETPLLGEEAMLGTLVRTATARAHSTCHVRVVHRDVFLRTLANCPSDQEILQPFLDMTPEALFPPLSVREQPLLKGCGCSEAFFSFLEAHVEHRIVGAGDPIVVSEFHQNIHPPSHDGDLSMCRINHGCACIVDPDDVGSDEASDVSDEDWRGPGTCLHWDTLWNFRVEALEICCVSILHSGVVARALESMPADRDILMPILARQHRFKLRSHGEEKIGKVLRKRAMFENTSPEFLTQLVQRGTIRIFMPGERIIEQGSEGYSMFILASGKANLVKEQFEEIREDCIARSLISFGSFAHGMASGELVMLGVQPKRTASIIAATVCCVWEVEHKDVLSVLHHHPPERLSFLKLIEKHLDDLVAPRIAYFPLFANFHANFRQFLCLNCERRLFFPGEIVVSEGSTGDRMYIVNFGSIAIELQHHYLMSKKGGFYFGFANMTQSKRERGRERYPFTVITESLCQIIIINQATYLHAMERHGTDARDVARSLESEDRVSRRRQQVGFERTIRRRKGLSNVIETLSGGLGSQSSKMMLHSSFHSWRMVMVKGAEIRRELEEQALRNNAQIDTWLARRSEQMKSVQCNIDLKSLIAENTCGRGPLILGKGPKQKQSPTAKPAGQLLAAMGPASPYASPNPLLKRPLKTYRESRRVLPPLDSAAAAGVSEAIGSAHPRLSLPDVATADHGSPAGAARAMSARGPQRLR